MEFYGSCRAVEQFPAAIGANVVAIIGALSAECAFETANESARALRRQICAAALAIGAHFQH
jgi:hypothetical protein